MRRVIWGIGIAALVVLLAYMFLPWSQGRHTSPEVSGSRTQAEGGKWSAGHRAEAPGHGQDFANRAMRELAQTKPRRARFSQGEINEINRLIQGLKQQGRAGVTAIIEFLQSGQDVSFADYNGDAPPEYQSLRLAMIDVLGEIGGQEATDFMAGMLQTTTKPEEVAAVARALEMSAPRAYRAEILKTVLTRFDQTLDSTAGQYPGLNHFFGVIEDYGDDTLAAPLESICRNSPAASAEFALMALTRLPEGEGIPTLVRIVNEISGDPGAHGTRYDMALRMLTQASREYPGAAEAFLKLTTTNKLSTSALIEVAATLGGTEHQLITKSSAGSQEGYTEIYVNANAAESWSDAEIDQRIGLIELILRSNPQPPAAKSLEEARNRLLVWKQGPIAGGRRIKQ